MAKFKPKIGSVRGASPSVAEGDFAIVTNQGRIVVGYKEGNVLKKLNLGGYNFGKINVLNNAGVGTLLEADSIEDELKIKAGDGVIIQYDASNQALVFASRLTDADKIKIIDLT